MWSGSQSGADAGTNTQAEAPVSKSTGKKKWGKKKQWGLRVMRRTAEDERRVGIKEHEPTKRNKVKQRRKNEGEFVEKPRPTAK